MEQALNKARHYRDQAAHMRELAAKDDAEDTRNALIQLAENYERLCHKYVEAAVRKSPTGTVDFKL